MGLTIGNVDLGTQAHAKWSDGPNGTHEVSGFLRKSSLGSFLVATAQIVGLLDNPDEDAVAVTASQDPSRPGFYRVLGGSLDIDAGGMRSFTAPVKLELEAVPGRFAPRIESRLYGALRSNAHGIAVGSTVPWWATPAAATMDFIGHPGGSAPTLTTRTADTGSVSVQSTSSGTLFLDATYGWQCDPSDYYDGAAIIEVTPDGGTTWVRLPGRRIGAAVAASSTGWRINNGLVRVTYGGGDGLISVQHYMGGSWVTAKVYRVYVTAGAVVDSAIGAVRSVTILRNGPECVSVRLGLEWASYPMQMNLDLTLRRGSLWVDGLLSIGSSAASLLTALAQFVGIGRNTAEAATAHTSGMHATAADAAGGKFILNTSVAKINDLVGGGFQSTSSATTAFPFQIGYEPSGASGPDTFTNQTYSWFAAVNEAVRFARR